MNTEKLKINWQRFHQIALSSKRGRFITFSLILIVIGGLYWWGSRDTLITEADRKPREVTIASIANLSGGKSDLPLIGQVSSRNEIELRAEAQGQVTAVYHEEGELVEAGTVIAELENSAQKAGLLQAKAVVAQAEAQLRSGAINLNEAQTSLASALRSTFSSADDIVHNKIDTFFRDGRSAGPTFGISIIDSNTTVFLSARDGELQYQMNTDRLQIEKMMTEWQKEITNLNSQTDQANLVEKSKARLEQIRSLLDKMSISVNSFQILEARYAPTVDGYKATLAGARTALAGAYSTLTGSYNAYLGQKTTSQADTDLPSINEANLEQARAGLYVAQTNYNKTIIKSPIAGTLNNFNLKRGDFVSMYQPVAIISNNSNLQIETAITEDDQPNISVGNRVLIDNQEAGTVINIAPALDSQTKKINVKIAITDNKINLINGQSINIKIRRNLSEEKFAKPTQIIIPLSALKVEPNRMSVFIVKPDNTLKALPVITGLILGDKITISQGLIGSEEIVLDARGLKEGEKVKIKQ